MTSWAVMVALIDQPTTRREQIDDGSHVEPTFAIPLGEVLAIHLRWGGCLEGAVEHVRSDGGDLPLADPGGSRRRRGRL